MLTLVPSAYLPNVLTGAEQSWVLPPKSWVSCLTRHSNVLRLTSADLAYLFEHIQAVSVWEDRYGGVGSWAFNGFFNLSETYLIFFLQVEQSFMPFVLQQIQPQCSTSHSLHHLTHFAFASLQMFYTVYTSKQMFVQLRLWPKCILNYYWFLKKKADVSWSFGIYLVSLFLPNITEASWLTTK